MAGKPSRRALVWVVLALCAAAGVACLAISPLGRASAPLGWTIVWFSIVLASIEAVLWASRRRRAPGHAPGFAFPRVRTLFDPEPLLLAEFEYARETAGQAMADRNGMVGFYLVAVTIIATVIAELLNPESDLGLRVPPIVAGLLLWALVVVGWILYLMLIRLRQAWVESALAMNQIKAFFVQHAGPERSTGVLAALRWRPETLPAPERRWNVFHCSALLFCFLNGLSFALGALLVAVVDPGSPETPLVLTVGIPAALGVAMMGYGIGMYGVFLRPMTPARTSPHPPDGSLTDIQPARVVVHSTERVYDGFFQVDKVIVEHESYRGGMSGPHERLVFERGDSVAVLLYIRDARQVVLVQQFRYPAYLRERQGWLWEVIAGTVDGDRDAESVARAEAMEEAGYALDDLHYLMTVYPSPGSSSERVHVYLAPVTPEMRVERGGGLAESGEDILVRGFSLDEALAMTRDGRVSDAKSVLVLQYLAMNWDSLGGTPQ